MLSLYLDFYPPIIVDDNETRREFLKLYLHEKPKSELEREHNRETKLLAENIRSKRQLELQANPHGFISPRRRKADFIDFFRQMIEPRKKLSKSALRIWQATLHYLEDFTGGKCTFSDIDQKFVERFAEYLLSCEPYKVGKDEPDSKDRSEKKILSPNTAQTYQTRFFSAVKEAVKKKYIGTDPTLEVKAIKGITAKREFLLLEELKVLAQTECDIPGDLRRAALFSALTGLRHSDICNIRWKNVRQSKNGYFLDFQIKKTKEDDLLPISDEARELLGEFTDYDEKIFPNLKYGPMTSVYVERWTKAAGIERRVTFHSFRHSFAVTQISEGTDVFTLQKLLGHRDIKTTQIYAKLLSDKKRAAVNKISLK